ncbi:MAG: hypothetical protein K9H84_04875 [Bacteroidales bacterium]|nr:hypothetical protein [Bacteroidales bacterium]
MKAQKIIIKTIEKITHDTLRIVTEKPENYFFEPGQATEVSIDKEGWREEGRPFTFTSLPEDNYLEFTIKTYPEKDGTTDKLLDLKAGDKLIVKDIFGAITFQGKGTFIAGGAGITPFIAIFRKLHKENKLDGNKLFFSNKTSDDIILKEELEDYLGSNFINILSKEKTGDYFYGRIDEAFLKEHVNNLKQKFYLCGPWDMVDELQENLKKMGVDENNIVREE